MDYKKLAAEALANGEADDFTKTESGPTREAPAKGLARLRLISYIELGVHTKTIQGKQKSQPKFQLTFELSGPKHQPVEKDGEKFPAKITITENLSRNEKANAVKLFKAMNYTGKYTHFAQMLGEDFLGEVVHVEKEKDGKKIVYANLRNENGFTIRAPFVEDAETGESKRVQAGSLVSDIRLFFWNSPTREQWDSLYIDGTYDDGRSKNFIQATIMSADNWKDCKMAQLLKEGGVDLDAEIAKSKTAAAEVDTDETGDTPDTKTASTSASADPLEGVA